jgi:phage-related protein
VARFKINLENWTDYWPSASLEKPNDDRQPSAWSFVQVGTNTVSVVASTSSVTPSKYVLGIQGAITGTSQDYYGHDAGTAPFRLKANNARGYTIECQAKVISTSLAGGNVLYFKDNALSGYLNLGVGGFKLDHAGTVYSTTTDQDFLRYRVTVLGSACNIYVEDRLVIAGSLSLAGTSAGACALFFGNVFATYGGHCQYGYVRYNTTGAYAPNEPVNDGWTYKNFDVQDARKLTEYSIIRSDRSIVPDVKVDPAKVKISGSIMGSCWPSFRGALRRFKRLLDAGTHKITLDNDRFIEANYSSFSLSPVTQSYSEYSAAFSCRYPYWRNYWASYFSTAPVSNSTFYVYNNGDVEVPLLVVVSGAASGTINNNIQIQNLTASQNGKYTGVLAQTQEALLDRGFNSYADYSVTVNSASSFGSYDGELFSLVPGENKFVFTGGAVGTIEFYWREANLL